MFRILLGYDLWHVELIDDCGCAPAHYHWLGSHVGSVTATFTWRF